MRNSRRVIVVLWISLLLHSVAAAQDSLLPSLPGQIAYVDTDQNIHTLDLSENREVVLTTDSSPTRQYRWPTWSTDGRLAYFLMRRGGQIGTEVFISPDGVVPGSLVYSGSGEVFNYAYWSPQNCSLTPRCRDLAVLLGSEGGLLVQRVRDGLEQPNTELLGRGGPFYFSWSPDGSRMIWQRNNSRLDIFDLATSRLVETLPVTVGAFQAPAWSPVDDRLLVGVQNVNGETTDLAILANSEQRTLAARLVGTIAFAWSPSGDYVAYTDREGRLTVVDAYSGGIAARSPVTGVFAFFWSPDSRHIAYITLATPPSSFTVQHEAQGKVAAYVQNSTGIAWSVLDVATGATRRFGAFLPTQDMLYLFLYFDQFAQSHRLWSPDSRYLIYAEVTPDGDSVISLLDTTQSNTVPFALAQGSIGVWSFE